MVTLENDHLKIAIKTKGAELDSLFSKQTNLEYLWSGDAKFWNKKSPILFPIVGTLKQNTYFYNNKAYILTRHGFARDMEFLITSQTETSATFMLTQTDDTLLHYPFPFILEVTYTVEANMMHVKYKVSNPADENMFFSIGGHPAFKVPLEKHLVYTDYYFEFDQLEDAYRWKISSEGLIEPLTVPFLINTTILPISRELFSRDAIIFKYLNSTKIALKCKKSKHHLQVSFPGFPFIGLWAAPNADFVCIEPWCGIADSTVSKQEFIMKEGVNLLTGGQTFERTWSVSVF
jgi:galactose mutarotase-like enzyme